MPRVHSSCDTEVEEGCPVELEKRTHSNEYSHETIALIYNVSTYEKVGIAYLSSKGTQLTFPGTKQERFLILHALWQYS